MSAELVRRLRACPADDACHDAADRIEVLTDERDIALAMVRTERDLRRRYGIAYAKKVQQLHEAAEDHAHSLAALVLDLLEIEHWKAEAAKARTDRDARVVPGTWGTVDV